MYRFKAAMKIAAFFCYGGNKIIAFVSTNVGLNCNKK
jgi:hypothetical protein